jgi:EF hand/EF-hand domain pair
LPLAAGSRRDASRSPRLEIAKVTRQKGRASERNEEIVLKVIKRRTLLLASALALALSPAIAASVFSGIDTDNDGTIDLNEAKAAAGAVFDKLDVDHDGTLDRAELRGRVLERDWATADPDNDKTLTKDEYLNYVEFAFKRADKDGDGTLDAKEARTHAGRVLLRLLRAR